MKIEKNSTIEIDKKDEQILSILKKDAKMSIKEIAAQIGLSNTPTYERIKKLEESKIIEKYIAVVDEKKLMGGMIVFCSVSLDVQKKREIVIFNKAVQQIPEVQECYLMGGANDFLLKIIVKNLDEYHRFSTEKLAVIENVNQIKSTFVLAEVKK